MKSKAELQQNRETGLAVGRPRVSGDTGDGRAAFLWRLVLSCLGGGCAVLSFVTAFSLPVDAAAVLTAALLMFALLGGVFALRRAALPLVLALSAAWAVLGWKLWDEVRLGLLKTVSLVLELLSANSVFTFTQPGADITAMDGAPAQTRVTLFLLMALFPWAVLLVWAAVRRLWRLLPFLLTFPAVAVPLWFYIQPSPAALMGLILYWAALAFTRGIPRADRGAVGRLALLSLPALCLLLLALHALIPQQGYVRAPEMEQRRLEAEALLKRLPSLLASDGGAGPAAGGTFLSLDQSRRSFDELDSATFTGQTALRVRVEDGAREALYLKGYTGGVYTTGGWEMLGEEAEGALTGACAPIDPQNLTAYRYAAEHDERVVTVRNLANPKVVYAPNWLVTTPRSFALGEFSGDGTIRARGLLGLEEYSLSYLPPSANLLRLRGNDFFLYVEDGGDAVLRERPGTEEFARYAQAVYEAYTQVPEDLEGVLDALLEEAGLNRGPIRAQAAAFGVSHLLERLGRYTLTPGPVPEGQDFTAYFLTENRQGFCVHFATAGVLLMRRLGIPTRYCEGYLVTPTDLRYMGSDGYANIPDRRAHAWAEYYQEGVGWVSMECTPGFNPQSDVAQPNDETNETQATPAPSPTPMPTPTPEILQGGPDIEVKPPQTRETAALKAMLRILIWSALAAGVVILRRSIRLSLRRKAFAQSDTNRAALAVYAASEALTPYAGEMADEMTALAEKARFSRHTLTHGEVCALKDDYGARVGAALAGTEGLRHMWLLWGLCLTK